MANAKAGIGALLLGAFFLGLTGCAPQLATSTGPEHHEAIAAIRQRVASMRGLSFATDVPVVFETREGLRRHLEAELLEEYDRERIREVSLAYATLGLYPRGVDLKESLLKLYSSEVLGFYSPKLKQVMLLGAEYNRVPLGGGHRHSLSDVDEGTLVHELAHALQDQHFSLRERLKPARNADEAMALRALAEGDSILTELSYPSGEVSEHSLSALLGAVRESRDALHSAFADVPAFVTDKFLFQYEAGASFVYQMFKKQGWRGVDLLYAFPPLSTEQMLHPEKYYDLPDPPTRIEAGDLSALFSPSWKEIENNALGELMIGCLFKGFFPEAEAKKIASGWGGDRFVAFLREGQVAFLWVTVWDTSEDAGEFTHGYRELLKRKYASSGADDSEAYVEKRDRVVLVIEGLEKRRVEDGIAKIWQGLQLLEEPSPDLRQTPIQIPIRNFHVGHLEPDYLE